MLVIKAIYYINKQIYNKKNRRADENRRELVKYF